MKLSACLAMAGPSAFALMFCLSVCSQCFASEGISLTSKSLKILYYRHEKAAVEVVLKNNTQKQLEDLTLVAVIEKDIEQSSVIFRQGVDLGPGEENSFVIPWNVGGAEFGRELRIDVYSEGQLIASGADHFSVADNVWKVAITGGFVSLSGLEGIEDLDEFLDSKARNLRDRFVNWWNPMHGLRTTTSTSHRSGRGGGRQRVQSSSEKSTYTRP